ncbi:MAG: glycine cleavage system protein R [Tepidisphaeraceae bacterium]
MTHHAILTAIGADRPGIVDEVSEFIFQRGGNIEDSRMVNLRGQFAMMVLIGGAQAVLARVGDDLSRLESASKLHAELRPATQPTGGAGPSAQAIPYRLTATAMDQAGLVHRVAHLLRDMNVNIESLDTHLAPAPYTGAPVFEMELTVSVPRQTPIAKLREDLGKLCDELNIDWQLTAL